MTKLYNNKVNILKALAILVVVSGHLEFSIIPMFPPYSFQVILFFFIAGMLYKEKYTFVEFVKRRIKSLLVPYFLYSFVYLGITEFITPITGKFWGLPVTLKNELLMPFLTGHHLDLISPLWFVPCLFITLVIYKILFSIKINDNIKLFIYFLLSLLAIKLQSFSENIYLLWILRTMFALFFVHLGFLYNKNKWEEKYNIFSFKILSLVLVFQSLLWLTNQDYNPLDGIGLHFLLVWGKYNNWIAPILTSLTGIWMCLFIVEMTYCKVKDWVFLNKIGQNTYHIMANHLLVFNIITYSLLAFKGIDFSIKNNVDIYWFYNPIKTTYFYFVFGIIVTTYFGEFLKYIKKVPKMMKLKLKPD